MLITLKQFHWKRKSLKDAVAKGNVIIESNQEGKKSKADIGIYNASKDIIQLKGNVIILNQNSKITGSNGITNIKTGISKITGSANKKERVKGILSPSNNKKKGG